MGLKRLAIWALGISILFLVPAYFEYIWLGYLLTIAGLGLFYYRLHVQAIRDEENHQNAGPIKWVLGLVMLSMIVNVAIYLYWKPYDQEITLEDRLHRDYFDSGIYLRNELMQVYQSYLKAESDQSSIVVALQELKGDKLRENGKYDLLYEQEVDDKEIRSQIFYDISDSLDHIEMFAVNPIIPGRDKEFHNFNGLVGKVEYYLRLDSTGVHYERQN